MIENWPVAFGETELYEGWHKFSNDPIDPGGATYNGITQAEFYQWLRQNGANVRPVRTMTDAETKAIAKTQYWDSVRGDELPSGLDLLMFDISFNMGPVRAIKLLQSTIGVPSDGHFGLQTMGVVGKKAAIGVIPVAIKALALARMSFWERLSTWWHFGAGWQARSAGVTAKALLLAKGPRI